MVKENDGFFEACQKSLENRDNNNSFTFKKLVYGFVGLGLMGGSISKAIKKNLQNPQVFACDINTISLEDARLEGIIDKAFSLENVDSMLKACDIVFICLYPRDAVDFINNHQATFKKGSIITDIAGVKGIIYANINWYRNDCAFISTHPMAGNEREGYAHSDADIFIKRNCIFLPPVCSDKTFGEEALSRLKQIALLIGFSRLIDTTPKVHDHKIAFTSQLCHVIASSMVDSAEDTNITAFGGGSYEDLTRIAMINAPLWTELFLSNKEELLLHIESFRSSLEKLQKAIQNDDSETINNMLKKVRSRRIAMSQPKVK